MSEFARIRKRLLAINKRADNNGLNKRRKAVDTKHVDLRDLPIRFQDEKWCREARARFLPSLVCASIRNDSWVRLEIEKMGWELKNHTKTVEKAFYVAKTSSECDWECFEVACSVAGGELVLTDAIFHEQSIKEGGGAV
jgi:hypothetical protein